jgi:hypothetical protein
MVRQKQERHILGFCKHLNQIIQNHGEVELTISLRAFIRIKKATTRDKEVLTTLYLCPTNIYTHTYIIIYLNYYCNN